MKKVMFYIHSLNKGGAERVLLAVADYLSTIYDIVIVTDTVDELEYALPAGVRRVNLDDTGVSTIQRLKLLRTVSKKEQPDKMVGFMISSAIRLIVANIFCQVKLAAAIRSNPYDEFSSFLKRRLLNFLFLKCETVICQTTYQKDFFDKQVRKKCSIIPNPVFGTFCIESYHGIRDKKIVTAGRLFDYKNHKLLIEAFSMIQNEFPDYQLFIYGEGPYREATQEYIHALGLEKKVFLPGDTDDVAGAIEKAALFILPSDTEGMPNALMEAMALGLPVIATDCPCGGPRSLITQGKNGYLCEMGNAGQMAEFMENILRDEELAENLSLEAAKIQNTHAINKICSMWRAYIEQ